MADILDREAIANALFALLDGVKWGDTNQFGWNKSSRHGQIWGATNANDQPGMFLVPDSPSETYVPAKLFGPSKIFLHYRVIVYTRADGTDFDTTPETEQNQILTAIAEALNGPIGGIQNLGLSYVAHTWIEGEIFKDTGILDQQCALSIPIRVLTAR